MCIRKYKRWDDVPEHFKTKTQLKTIGLKLPKNIEPSASIRCQIYSGWKELNLYSIENCIPIKKAPAIKQIELTVENLAEALYIINKSTKKSRDTKKENYGIGKHEIVQRAKKRENELYNLKDRVLNKMMDEGGTMSRK